MNKKVGILGSGMVGQALARGFLKNGYDVLVGTNHPEKEEELIKTLSDRVKTGSFADAARYGDIVVLAVKGSAAESTIQSVGPEHFDGKTVLDTTNPIADAPPVNGVLEYFTSMNSSLLERLQALVPGARFVKCFSCTGAAHMVDPDFPGGPPTMFICGNNEEARQDARTILDQFGWETEDLGKAEAARAIEPLAMLWCIPGFLENNWMHALKLLRK